jgi:Na+-translocating ferredoxin:NAD+ oxidoreductase RnfC subunit
MRTIDYNQSEPTQHITSAFLCSQCGVCELLACDFMQISPRKVFAEYKKLLIARGIKNPHHRSELKSIPELEYRKISIPTIIKKLGISQYIKSTPSTGYRTFDRVKVPLNRHTGVPAAPTVKPGQKVRMGDVIAASPLDSIGTIYHAPIAGKITEIAGTWIEICKYTDR